MQDNPPITENHLLAALPENECAHLAAHLTLVDMPLGKVLYESGGQLHHVFFRPRRSFRCSM